MQKTPAREILTEAFPFPVAQLDVPMPGDMEERVISQQIIEQWNARLSTLDRQRRALRDRNEKIRNARRVGVPITAAVILQPRDGESGRRGSRRERRESQGGDRAGEDHSWAMR